jgi:SAM-dependent methyltransferase
VLAPLAKGAKMSSKSRLRAVASRLLHSRSARKLLERIPLARNFYHGWERTHPFDRRFGIDTSGIVPVEKMGLDATVARHMLPYAGSQPSIVRRAIATLPELADYCFVDLGCGKGRPLLVASEFSFRRIIGVELSRDLVASARRNVAAVRRRFPGRPAIEVIEDNVARFRLPDGKVVLFFYHSFDADLMVDLINRAVNSLAGPVDHLFVIYYNPVWGELLDSSPAFRRWYAGTLPYDPSEIGFGPDREDTVVIWQSVRGAYPQSQDVPDYRIVNSPARESALA